MTADVTVRHNTEASRYEALLGDQVVGVVMYQRQGDRMIFEHTIVQPEFRGRGVAGQLVKAALDDVAANGWTMTNYCGYITDFIAHNPGYASLADVRSARGSG
ncbi:MAG TPA: GNAT family N-acetyltransferase [Pseudonocardiaceae bacterium]|jgi:hypothetical protein